MNEFKLLGRVGKLEMDYKESGTVITTISLGVKNEKKEYENFYITFFNTKRANTAELLGDEVVEGDYIRVNGKLAINKYIPQGADKPKYTLRLIGWGYKKVVFDDDAKKFVDIEPETTESEEIVKFSETENQMSENESPN